jgi:hypothetical protein
MQTWALAAPIERPASPVQSTLADVIGSIGQAGFARAALEHVNGSVGAGSWSVYRVWRDRPPVMHLSASRAELDITKDCFAAYRDGGLYLRDRSFEPVRGLQRPGHAVIVRMHADEAPNADHRDAIYRRHGMLERLSVARLDADGSLLAVNRPGRDRTLRRTGAAAAGVCGPACGPARRTAGRGAANQPARAPAAALRQAHRA